MVYNEIGKTGMKVANLAFGASSLGGVFHDLREEEGIRAVHTAVDNGINFIDVSPYYGHLKAEMVLGKALKEIARDRYYLSTKVGRYGKDGVNTWDYSAQRATDSVYESMQRLNVDFIDLINVHDIEFADLQQVVDETLPALVALKKKGVVGHVGITDLQPENLKWVIEHSPEGTVESVLCFCHYSLNDDMLVDYLDFFEAHGVGVINASPLSMGSRSRPAEGGLQARCRFLHGERLSHRETRHTVCHQSEPEDCHDTLQQHQSRQCAEEHSLRRRGDGPSTRGRGAANHR